MTGSYTRYPAAGGGGSGDVTGPASSVDNQIALFSGGTGKVIKALALGTAYQLVGMNAGATAPVFLSLAGTTNQVNVGTSGTTLTLSLPQSINTGASPTFAGLTLSGLTASRALQTDGSSGVTASSVTATELGYLSGVTSAVQTQIDGKLSLAGGTLTGNLALAGDPSTSLQAATKQYVDAAINGVNVKNGVRTASTANLTLSGEQTIDGVACVTGDRVLAKDQSTASDNGIYVVAVGAWSRASDADAYTELNSALVTVNEGTANANTGWYQSSELTSLLDPQTWSQFFGAGTYAADGQGLTLTGSTFALALDGTSLAKSGSGLKVNATVTDSLPPVGSIIAYNPGYYTGAANAGFTVTGPAGNTVSDVNTYLPTNWRVCDGTALNNASSPIWNAAGRYLPDLTDSRFLMGSTTAGATGGENTNSHTHSVPAHYHGLGTGADLAIGTSGSHSHNVWNNNTNSGAGHIGFTVAAGGAVYSTETSFAAPANTHTHSTSDFTGRIGLVTGGVDGNAAMTSGTPNDTENRPKYLSTFYIIRVA